MQRSHQFAQLAVALALSLTLVSCAQQQTGRHLLNPIYEEKNKFVGPDTPYFRYKTNPAPAKYNSDWKVRSEHPWADVYHKEKDWVNAKGQTKVDTWEGAKFKYSAGKGASEYKFNSGKRAFEVKHKEDYFVNFPETDIKIAGGQPIAVDQKVAVYGPIANETVEFKTGDGPNYKNDWQVNVGSTDGGHGRRRSLLAFLGRHLLNPIYEEKNKFVGPDTPYFRYKTNPAPAKYNSDWKVRSEHPWADVYHKEKDWVNAKGQTKVDTWEGAKFKYSAGKGASEYKFNSGKRAFEVKHKEDYFVNFPETDIKIAGGQPIAVDQKVAVYGPIANETVEFKTGDGPNYKNDWQVNVGSTDGGHGRRRNLLSPIYSQSNSFTGANTPSFRYKTNPSPASTSTSMKVRSEKPFVDVSHKDKDAVNARGSTSVQTTEGSTFFYSSGRRLMSFLGRHLLNPIYEEKNKFVGPDTPYFRYKTNPAPAKYNSDWKVRSEHPWADVYHKEKDWVNAKGQTKVDTWEGAKFNYKAGKGASEYKFNSGKRAFEVNHKEQYNVNFPETDIKIAGGQPIAVDQKVAVYGPIANETVQFNTGDGPNYKNDWQVNVGSTDGGHGRRRH